MSLKPPAPAPATLTAPAFAARLNKLNACHDAREWAEGLDYATAWATCQRPDWLLWLLAATAPLDVKTNERLICRFAREVVHLNPDPRVLACIEVREAWVRGEVPAAARDAAWAAAGAAARDAAWAAARAAMAAAGDAAGDAAWAAAGAAARDAAGDAAGAAWVAARVAARAKQAAIIRELVPMPVLA